MIYAINIKCAECRRYYVLFIGENTKIKTPYVCPDCFKIVNRNSIKTKEYEILFGGGNGLRQVVFFMGYKRPVPKLYIPTVKETKEKEVMEK